MEINTIRKTTVIKEKFALTLQAIPPAEADSAHSYLWARFELVDQAITWVQQSHRQLINVTKVAQVKPQLVTLSDGTRTYEAVIVVETEKVIEG